MADNTSHLPPEIIELILSRLSLKSLLRLKTVSKSWNTMISDPAFVKIHHQRAKGSNSDNLFLLRKSRISPEGFSLARLDDRKLHNVRVLEAPRYGWGYVLCFCKGLLLVQHIGTPWAMTLWNPSTGAEKRLLLPYFCFGSNYGLSHDPITGDFKVVVMHQRKFYAVYSFNNNSWKKMNYEWINFSQPSIIQGVCVDGASYWVSDKEDDTYSIIYFDPRDDKFKCLEKPENVGDNEQIFLVDSSGSLCLYCNGRDKKKTVSIWTKEKGIDNSSWKRLMDVDMPILSFKPQCFIGNKIVIQEHSDDRLVVYNPYEKRVEQFDEDTKVSWRGLVPYVDSPFFPTRNPGPILGKRKRL